MRPGPVAPLACGAAEKPGQSSPCHVPASGETGQGISFMETAFVFLSLFLRPVRFWGYWNPPLLREALKYSKTHQRLPQIAILTSLGHEKFCLHSKDAAYVFSISIWESLKV